MFDSKNGVFPPKSCLSVGRREHEESEEKMNSETVQLETPFWIEVSLASRSNCSLDHLTNNAA